MNVGSATEVGLVRDRNEDALLVDEPRGLFVVADGMGGHPAGDVASQLAVDSLADTLSDLDEQSSPETPHQLSRALQQAHDIVIEDGHTNPDRRGMGTTAVVAHVSEPAGAAWVAHVGDSRAYLARNGDLQQLTDDHATDGFFGPSRITQALGGGTVTPDVLHIDIEDGDRLVLCTDGLTNMISDDEIHSIVQDNEHAQGACDQLVKAAVSAGGADNVTVIVLDIDVS